MNGHPVKTSEEQSGRRFFWLTLGSALVASVVSLMLVRHKVFIDGWNLKVLGMGVVLDILRGLVACGIFPGGALLLALFFRASRKITTSGLFARSVACGVAAVASVVLYVPLAFLIPSLDSLNESGMKKRIESEFDLTVFKLWAERARSEARPMMGNEEERVFQKLYWLPDAGSRMVYSGTNVLPDIERVFGTYAAITIASNSPTQVYTEIAVNYGAALLVGDVRDLEVRDHQRRSELAPGVYLWRYLKP